MGRFILNNRLRRLNSLNIPIKAVGVYLLINLVSDKDRKLGTVPRKLRYSDLSLVNILELSVRSSLS